ncbi:geranylgeranylglycerol-phosphate geranylgeranyltransferase [Wenyingzhuangia sp. chi5]|uniref:Geranylgeranylglycerol-phosphate geranylgeranyltransferase n=1 Tax=Wenyingzhuangia gilva TaxID=3057677 RepID=A0ABT8VN78_9FLAO|nr:geranylgeranylglycerol-phosphate geranylgeranyltransferase [Wenyingzhuangia sp. chi5]MDO3693424.1 geranylgeranylglycerol-phosphate geranylgeranyltransferase [Wenyingzhuangia sp. chi5]
MNKAATKRHKFLALFSVVRGYNIMLLTVAQYLAAIFVFTVNQTLREVLLDWHLHLVVLSTISVVSAGYIINDFYDAPIDAINKPVKTQIGNWVSQATKLQVYFALNFIAFVFGMIISWKAGVFFGGYIFLIWLYSHKLQRYPFIRILSVSILDVLPFFVIFVYYENISELIITHGLYLYLLILLKELIKDFERAKGALLNDRETLVLKYGDRKVKTYVYVLLILLTIPTYFLLRFPEVGTMKYYFYTSVFWGPLFLVLLIKAKKNKHYFLLHNFLRVVLVIGVFSLSLIDTSVLLIRILNEVRL